LYNTTGSDFTDQLLTDNEIKRRVEELVDTMIDWSLRMRN